MNTSYKSIAAMLLQNDREGVKKFLGIAKHTDIPSSVLHGLLDRKWYEEASEALNIIRNPERYRHCILNGLFLEARKPQFSNHMDSILAKYVGLLDNEQLLEFYISTFIFCSERDEIGLRVAGRLINGIFPQHIKLIKERFDCLVRLSSGCRNEDNLNKMGTLLLEQESLILKQKILNEVCEVDGAGINKNKAKLI